MNKKLIRLAESDLHRIVKESVNRIIKESTINEVMYNGYSYHGNDKTSWDMAAAQRKTNETLRLGDLFNAVESGDINKAQTVLKQLKHNIKQSRKDDANSDSIYGNELDVQPSLRGESEWNPTEEDIREGGWLGPEWSKHARAIGGHHEVGDIVRSVIEHGNIPAGSIVKVTYVDHMRGYDIEDINTGKKWGESDG